MKYLRHICGIIIIKLFIVLFPSAFLFSQIKTMADFNKQKTVYLSEKSNKLIFNVIVEMEDESKYKFTFTYNTNNKLTSYIYESLNNQYWRNRRATLSYDSYGNLSSYLIEKWDGLNWKYSTRNSYTYNLNNKIISILTEIWEYQQWNYSQRYTFTYDSVGNKSSYLQEHWDTQSWIYREKISYTYDSNNNIITTLYEGWVGNYTATKYTSTYNSNGKKITDFKENWDGQNWITASLHTFTYDVNYNLILFLDQYWDTQNWINRSRTIYTYDSLNHLISIDVENWTINGWSFTDYRETYIYDSAGNLTIHYIDIYQGTFRQSYTYDSDNDIKSALFHFRFYNSQVWLKRSDSYLLEDSFGNNFDFEGHNISFFYEPLTNINDESSMVNKFSLSQNYPNPCNPTTTIKYSIPKQSNVILKVYDILGNEIKILVNEEKGIGSYKVEFDGTDLSSGIYLYNIVTGEFTETKKLLLLK